MLPGWVVPPKSVKSSALLLRGRGHVHQPGGPVPVVGVDIPLIAEGADALIERDGLLPVSGWPPGCPARTGACCTAPAP